MRDANTQTVDCHRHSRTTLPFCVHLECPMGVTGWEHEVLARPFLLQTEPRRVLRLIGEAPIRLRLAFHDALLLEKDVGAPVSDVSALVLLLAHEKGIEGVRVDTTEGAAKGGLGDAVTSEKVLDL